MQPTYAADAEAYREKVQAFLAEKLPADWQGTGALEGEEIDRFLTDWRKVLYEANYLAPGWPVEYGGAGLSSLEQVILAEEFARAGVPTGGHNDVFGIQMLGNTIQMWGTEEQKRYYLPRILSGADTWCQGYSEPNAGSDLGNVGLRAELDGDEWVLNGQKIWTSAGHLADHIFTLARSDPEAPKHKGITFLLVPMDQPGIEVRPIKMISGESEFNEVFYTDARCPKDNVLGGVNNGWAVAMSLLGFERGEAAATGPIRYEAEFERLLALARRVRRGRRPGDPPASRLVLLQGAHHAVPRSADAHQVPRRPPSRSGRGDLQALLERVPPQGHRTGGRHPRRRRPRADRPSAVVRVPDRRSRCPELLGVVGRYVPQRPRRHDLRRVVADPAQHHRRDDPRPAEGTATLTGWPANVAAVAARPTLWATGVRQLVRMLPRDWWRRPPYLPRPSAEYLGFRMLTQYGDAAHAPEPADVVNYLRWCRDWERTQRP